LSLNKTYTPGKKFICPGLHKLREVCVCCVCGVCACVYVCVHVVCVCVLYKCSVCVWMYTYAYVCVCVLVLLLFTHYSIQTHIIHLHSLCLHFLHAHNHIHSYNKEIKQNKAKKVFQRWYTFDRRKKQKEAAAALEEKLRKEVIVDVQKMGAHLSVLINQQLRQHRRINMRSFRWRSMWTQMSSCKKQ